MISSAFTFKQSLPTTKICCGDNLFCILWTLISCSCQHLGCFWTAPPRSCRFWCAHVHFVYIWSGHVTGLGMPDWLAAGEEMDKRRWDWHTHTHQTRPQTTQHLWTQEEASKWHEHNSDNLSLGLFCSRAKFGQPGIIVLHLEPAGSVLLYSGMKLVHYASTMTFREDILSF